MAQNIGQTDKYVRIVIGALAGVWSLGILANALPGPAILSPILGIVAAMLLGTAFTGFCGLYAALGIDTCAVKRS